MPVEECGNILILAAALAKFTDDLSFLRKYEPVFRKWAEYLADKGYDPENQLCTDDFAGHLAHNTNLSIKAILALGGWSIIAGMLGRRRMLPSGVRSEGNLESEVQPGLGPSARTQPLPRLGC